MKGHNLFRVLSDGRQLMVSCTEWPGGVVRHLFEMPEYTLEADTLKRNPSFLQDGCKRSEKYGLSELLEHVSLRKMTCCYEWSSLAGQIHEQLHEISYSYNP